MLDELIKFSKNIKCNFFVPGHKFGRGMTRKFKKNFFKIDVTEFDETDILSDAKGIILEAENNASRIYKSQKTRFLVNGSSSGIVASINSLCSEGDYIIIPRNCHVSVINGVILSGAVPVFYETNLIEKFGVYDGVKSCQIESLVNKYSSAKAVVLTSPNYFGICCPVEEIFELTKKYNIPLLVDAAHSAHFVFGDGFPANAAEFSDISIMSTHKTLPCLGQTSLLHWNSSLVDYEYLMENLKLIETTSPSYIFLSSIDEGLRYSNRKRRNFSKLASKLNKIRDEINDNTGVLCLKIENDSCFETDPLRLVLNFSNFRCSAHKVAEILQKKFGVKFEMVTNENVVAIFTIFNSLAEIKRFLKSIYFVDENFEKFFSVSNINNQKFPEIILNVLPREAFFSKNKKNVDIRFAEGEVCCETIFICPPGVPISIPGQLLTSEVIRKILKSNVRTYIEVLK